MKSPFGLFVLGLMCALGGAICWHLASLERDIASTGALLLTLQYEAAGQNAAKAASYFTPNSSLKASRQLGATADYWSQQYATLTRNTSSNADSDQQDAERLFIAANAAFREWQNRAQNDSPQVSLEQLESVIKGYADVVKKQSENQDAAYNYEFAVRQREILAGRTKPANAHPLSDHVTIHGKPGAAPKGNSSGEFKIIVPQQPDERKEDTTPGKAQKFTKKG